MKYVLEDLPYAYDALEPYIDEETMHLHHDKHHQTYLNNLNAAVEKYPELFEKRVEDLIKDLDAVPEDIRMAVRNNGGGHANHSFFWKSLRPGGGEINDEIKQQIEKYFGSFEAFQETFSKAAISQFGSGWAWLVKEGDTLKVVSTANQDSPLSKGQVPLLGLDVWEHAYYLKYHNVRLDYIKAFWHIVDWDEVTRRLKAN